MNNNKFISLTILLFSMILFSGCSGSNYEFRENLVEYTSEFEKIFIDLNKNSEDVLIITDFIQNRFSEFNTEVEKELIRLGHDKENFEYHGNGAFWRSSNYQLNEGLVSISFYDNGVLNSIEERYDGKNSYKYYSENGNLVYSYDGETSYSYYDDGTLKSISYNDGTYVEFDRNGREIYRLFSDGSWEKTIYSEINGVKIVERDTSYGSWSKYEVTNSDYIYNSFNYDRYSNLLTLYKYEYNFNYGEYMIKQLLLDQNKDILLYFSYRDDEELYLNNNYDELTNKEFNEKYEFLLKENKDKESKDYIRIEEHEVDSYFKDFENGISINNPGNSTLTSTTIGLGDDESTKVKLNGETHFIEIINIDEQKATILVDGKSKEFQIYSGDYIGDVYVYLNDLIYSSRDSVKSYVELILSLQEVKGDFFCSDTGSNVIGYEDNSYMSIVSKKDYCGDNNDLKDFYCSDDEKTINSKLINCKFGCSDGKCNICEVKDEDKLPNTLSIAEGESAGLLLNDKNYSIKAQAISDSKVLFTVNSNSQSIDSCEFYDDGNLRFQINDIVISTRKGIKSYVEIGYGSKIEKNESNKLNFDLEIKDVYKGDFHDYGFMSKICVNGDYSINDLNDKGIWDGYIPSSYVMGSTLEVGDNSVSGSIEDLKNGNCMDYGWTIQSGDQDDFDKYKTFKVYLDYDNEIKETNEDNNYFKYEDNSSKSHISVERLEADGSVYLKNPSDSSNFIKSIKVSYNNYELCSIYNQSIPAVSVEEYSLSCINLTVSNVYNILVVTEDGVFSEEEIAR